MDSIFDQLALLTRVLGSPVSAAALAAETLRHPSGRIDFGSLSQVLVHHGYDNKLSQRALADIAPLMLPALLVTRDGGALLVTAAPGGPGGHAHYEVLGPGGERSALSAEQVQERYSGYCWFLKVKPRRDARSELPEYAMGKGWFWKVIWRFKGYYAQVLVSSVLINVLALIGSLYVMNVYDRVIPNKAFETLWVLSIGVLAANLFEFLARMVRARLTDVAGKKADLIISAALFRRVLAMDLAHKPASAGSYANNLRDFEAVRDFMTSASLLALVDLPFVLLFIGVMGVIAGPLAVVPLLSIPVVVAVGLAAQVPLARYTNESMRESSQRQGLAVEAIEALETLKTNNAANWAQQRWERYTAATANSSIRLKDWSNAVVNFSVLVQQANTVFLVLYGTYLIHDANPAARITMGALIACVILSGRALAPLSQVAGLLARFQQARVALSGIDSVVARGNERDPARSYVSLSRVQGELRLEGAAYSYTPKGALVLQGLNLVIQPGEKVAVLGRIGSGKSTLLRLLAGLYAPGAGNVLLDGVDMRQIDPADLRKHVSLLGQQPRLLFGSLRENLDLGRMDRLSNDEELIAALKRFGLDKLVRAHPLGLDMPIGEDGHGLSGGQKQVVGLARLTLRTPQVVLLDEPTSGLDEMSERAALQAVADWAREKTMVVVTHRPQVLPFVQRVVVIDQGRVVLDGPRDAVLQRLGHGAAPAARPPAPAQPGAAPAAPGAARAGAPQRPPAVRVVTNVVHAPAVAAAPMNAPAVAATVNEGEGHGRPA